MVAIRLSNRVRGCKLSVASLIFRMHRRRILVCYAVSSLMAASILANAQSPTPSSGIEGAIRVSPIHGGPTRQGAEDSAPMANTAFDILNDTGVVSCFTTDTAGHFRVALSPGRYSINMHEHRKIGGCGTFAVEVNAGEFKKVNFECDSGIR